MLRTGTAKFSAALAAALCAAMLAWTGVAHAHAPGLSRGEYRVDGTEVVGAIVLARGDAEVAATAARGDLAAAIARGVEVTMGGAACAASAEPARPVEEDGVEVTARWRCARPDGAVRVRWTLLEALPPDHRHVAHLARGDEGTEGWLFRGHDAIELGGSPAPAPGVGAFVALGVEHILTGADHLLFLLALVLPGGSTRALAATVTAFTVGHSVTLALAALGVATPPASIVEPLVALSIAIAALENLRRPDPRTRWRVTLAFGLLHGFAFAGALRAIALPRAELPGALAGFNAGVEIGQLAVLLVALPLLARLRAAGLLGDRAVRAASVALAAAGAAWCVARVA